MTVLSAPIDCFVLRVFILSSLVAAPLAATEYHIKNYTTKDGLVNLAIRQLYIDRKGFLWVATYNGLDRFDGKRFKHYGMESGLVENSIWAVHEDRAGRMWVASAHGLSIIEGNVVRSLKKKDGLVGNRINAVASDGSGRVYIGCVEGLSVWQNGQLSNYTTANGLPENHVTTIFEDGDFVRVGTRAGLVNFKSGEPLNKILMRDAVLSLQKNKAGQLLVSTKGGKLYQVAGDRMQRLRKYRGQAVRFGDFRMLIDHKGEIAFASTSKGMFIHSGSKYLNYQGAASRLVTGATDTEGNLWAGTFGNGIVRFRRKRISTWKIRLRQKDARSLHVDARKRIFIGTLRGLTVHASGKTRHYPLPGTTKVRRFAEDEKGSVYVATDRGLFRWKNYRVTKMHVLRKASIYAISFFKNSLWIGLREGNLIQIELPSWKVTDHAKKIDAGTIYNFHVDERLYMIGYKGAVATDGQSFEWVMDQKEMGKHKLSIYYIDSKKRHYALSTRGFFTRLDREPWRWVSKREGVNTSFINSIVEGSAGNIWFGADNGILRFDGSHFTHLDEDDGASTNFCHFNSVARSGDELLFGTANGITIVNSKTIPISSNPPVAAITRVKVNDNDKVPTLLDDLEYGENNLYIEFASLSLTRPERVRYRYRLDSGPWTNTTQHFVNYTNLAPGAYIFEALGTNSDGFWSSKPARLTILINPPFWNTWWFYATVVGMAVGAAYAAYRWRVRELQKRGEELERLVDIRTNELNEERGKSEKLLLNVLPAEIAEELKSAGESKPRAFEQISVMFTDFVGFTEIAEKMTAEELVTELDYCFDYFDTVAERYNLEKLKTIGDSFMCAGGVPRANKTHAIDCVLAALEIQRFMKQTFEIKKELGYSHWRLRLGIHTGPVVAGVIGRNKFAYDVWGDTVNTASRLESTGIAGEINISEATYQKVKELFVCEPRGKVEAKGKGEVEMYFVRNILLDHSERGQGIMPGEKFRKIYDQLAG